MRLIDMVNTLREWPSMAAEEVESHSLRAYLTCDYSKLKRIEWAYGAFHKRKYPIKRQLPLTTDMVLFQELLFELGQVNTVRTCAEYAKQLRTNDKGNVDLHEFVLWWLVGEQQRSSESCSRKLVVKLRAKKKLRQARRVAVHAVNKRIDAAYDFEEKVERIVTRFAANQHKKIRKYKSRQYNKLRAVGVRAQRRAIRAASAALIAARKSKLVRSGATLLEIPSKIMHEKNAAKMRSQDRKMRKTAMKRMAAQKTKTENESEAIDAESKAQVEKESPADNSVQETDAVDNGDKVDSGTKNSEESDSQIAPEVTGEISRKLSLDETLQQQEAAAERALEQAQQAAEAAPQAD